MIRGTASIIGLKRGSTDIQKVYRGTNLVWENISKYIYIFRNNNTNTIRKYDLNGGLIDTLSTADVNYEVPVRFVVKKDDGFIYGFSRGTSTMLKLNPTDLSYIKTASLVTGRDVGVGPKCLFVAAFNRLQSRTFGTMSLINESSTFGSGGEAVIRVDDYSDAVFYYNDDNNNFRSFNKNNTTITQNYARATSIGTRNAIWTHPDEPTFVYVSNSSDTRRFLKDNSAAPTTLNNCDINTRDVLILSNGNVVYGLASNVICRTIENINADSSTNVFSNALGTTVLSLSKDDLDNVYAVGASIVRKISATGSTIWSMSSQTNLSSVVISEAEPTPTPTPVDLPIGSIEPYLKSFTGVPTIPSNYVECNGQLLDDIESPFHNTNILDLNITGRFLRGATASGDGVGGSGYGGSDLVSHSHPTTGAFANDRGFDGAQNTYDFGPTDVDVRPPYYSVVWIMKIK